MLFSQSQEDLNGISPANHLMVETNHIANKCGYVEWPCCSNANFDCRAVSLNSVSSRTLIDSENACCQKRVSDPLLPFYLKYFE